MTKEFQPLRPACFPQAQDKEIPPLPRTRLTPLVQIIEAVATASNGDLQASEVADAINRKGIYDPDEMMIYIGGASGLCEPVSGNPRVPNEGWNERADIVTDLFNCRFWSNPDASIARHSASDYMVLHIDADELSRRLWRFFFGDDLPLPVFRFSESARIKTEKPTLPQPLSTADSAQAPTFSPVGMLAIACEIQRQFWADPAKAPKQEFVWGWLKDKHPTLTDTERRAIERVACPIRRDGKKNSPRG